MYATMSSELTIIIQGCDYGTAADEAAHIKINIF